MKFPTYWVANTSSNGTGVEFAAIDEPIYRKRTHNDCLTCLESAWDCHNLSGSRCCGACDHRTYVRLDASDESGPVSAAMLPDLPRDIGNHQLRAQRKTADSQWEYKWVKSTTEEDS